MGTDDNSCVVLTREMLNDPLDIKIDDKGLDFEAVQKLAWAEAEKHGRELMLMGWYDRKAGRNWPDVPCCGHDKPEWLVYAESRGADLTIDVNDEDYVFVFWRDKG